MKILWWLFGFLVGAIVVGLLIYFVMAYSVGKEEATPTPTIGIGGGGGTVSTPTPTSQGTTPTATTAITPTPQHSPMP